MNKLEMAHQWAMKYGKVDSNYNRENTVQLAWDYADAMQDEADKRNQDSRSLTRDEHGNCLHFHHEFGHKKCMDCGASLEEWQPDWSQAPDWAVAWAMDMSGECYWHSGSKEPKVDNHIFESSADGHTFEAQSFNYQGNWQDSLRKRP